MSLNSDIRLRNGSIRLVLLIVLEFVLGSAVAQSNEDYLKSLAGEAETVTLDKQTEVNSIESKVSNTVSGIDETPGSLVGGLTIEQFEKVLQRSYIGSYLFYKRLSDSQKDEVYKSYQGNPDPDSVRDKILKVSKK